MTVRKDIDDATLATTDLTPRQRRIVRRAAYPALITAIMGPIAVVFVAGRSVPADNLDGHEYLHYALNHRTGETQSLLFVLTVLAMSGFLAALGVVYAQRSGRTTFTTVTMIGSAVAFFSLQSLASGCNLTIAQLGHGYSAFDTDPSAPLITTTLWNLTNVVVTLGYLPFVIAMFAAAIANRADPLLPRLLAGPVSMLIAGFAGIVLIATLYIDTGDFSPMSSSAGTITAAPMSLWLAAVAVAILWRTRSTRSHSRAAREDARENEPAGGSAQQP